METRKYKVITGIFEGHVFHGYPVIINKEERIWNAQSEDQSFPKENCVELKEVKCNI